MAAEQVPTIQPLPGPLGLNKDTIINQPVFLHITSGGTVRPPQVLDQYGHEIVTFRGTGNWTVRRVYFTPDGRDLFTLRPRGGKVAGFFASEARWVIEDEEGQEIGAIEPKYDSHYRMRGDQLERRRAVMVQRHSRNQYRRVFEIGFKNTAGEGERRVIQLENSLLFSRSALLCGGAPVALMYRTDGLPEFNAWSNSFNLDRFSALVAPGADLVWIASILSILTVAYAETK